MTQKLHDSGSRRQFEGGAVRDRGDLKPRPDLISPHAAMREGMILALGAEKYDTRNWELGMPISECLASAQRHVEQYKRGDTDEDHLAQARVNLGFAIHMEEECRRGGLDPKWDDMPKYALRWDQVVEPVPQLGDVDARGRVYVKMVGGSEIERKKALETLTANDSTSVLKGYPLALSASEPVRGWVPSTQRTPLPGRFASVLPQGECTWCAQGPIGANGLRQESWHFRCPYAFDVVGIPKTSAGNSCYVAGPMRGYEKFNFPTFDLARDLWAEQGWHVISPADLDRGHGFDEYDDPKEVDLDFVKEVIGRDIAAILSLDPREGDCLVVLPGWEASKGAAVEVALAHFLGLPIVRAFNGEVVKS